ncbi:DUF1848 family protein [Basfia succiniciproducens]|uniref:DUF1848 family protein n=1 Tax=Basfia succiniciproducens TaxID=653940 RepID=UPI003FCE9045
MIINTGGRTDTVHYYSKWLLKRFEEGYVLSRNPLFPNKVTRYELSLKRWIAWCFVQRITVRFCRIYTKSPIVLTPIFITPSPPTARILSRACQRREF